MNKAGTGQASSPATGLRLRPEVRWRNYADGVVVYVAETCETHILPADFLDMLNEPQQVVIVEQSGVLEVFSETPGGRPATRISRAFVEELVELKIFDRLN